MLFPEHTPEGDYEYINPMATISKTTSWKIPAAVMTPSPAYSKFPPKRPGPHRGHRPPHGRYKQAPSTRSRRSKSPLVSDPQTSTLRTETGPMKHRDDAVLQAAVSPTQRAQQVGLPARATSAWDMPCQPQLSRTTVGYPTTSTVRCDTSRHMSRSDVVDKRNKHVSAVSSNEYGEKHRYDRSSTFASLSEFHTISSIPSDIRNLNPQQVASCLRLLKIPEHCVNALVEQDVDGDLLMSIDESILTGEFKFSKFDAVKLMKFALHGYRPKI